MLRSDFEAHPLWATITSIERGLESLVDQAQELEQPLIGRIRFYLGNVRTMGDVAASNAALVSQAMLDQVHNPMSEASTWVTNRINSGPGMGYLDNAASSAEATLIPLGPWPRPYGTGGQVKQMQTLYEELLEQQRLGVAEIEAAHRRILEQVEEADARLQTHSDAVNTEIDGLRTDASTIVARSVDDQKARVDEVIAGGLAAVDDLRTKNTETFDWREFSEGSLPASPVVAAFDPGQDREPELLPGGSVLPVEDVLLQEREETTPWPRCPRRRRLAHRSE